ncbi:MAG TPA: hypothetical protein VF228_16345 [Iamia sp.]
MKPARPLLLVVALAVAAALLPAPPAAATFVNVGSVFNGTYTISLTPALIVTLSGLSGPCAPEVSPGFDLDLTATGATWSTFASAVGTNDPLSFTYSGTTYFMTLGQAGTVAQQQGTIGAAPTYLWTQGLHLLGRIYAETSPGNCTVNPTPRCSFFANFPTLGGSVQSPGGITGEDINVNSVLAAGGFATTFSSGCVAPFSAINNKTSTISNMQVVFP